MKRKLFHLILLTCFIVYSFSLTSIAKEPSSLTHKHDEEASSIIVTSGEEFILEVKANIDDADILTDVVIDTLSSGSTIKKTKINPIFQLIRFIAASQVKQPVI